MISAKYDPQRNLYVLVDGVEGVHINDATEITTLDERNARHLIRVLIDQGVSMTLPDNSYQAGELDATKAHLDDLRRIIFEDKQ